MLRYVEMVCGIVENKCESLTGSHELNMDWDSQSLGSPELLHDENSESDNALGVVLWPDHTHLAYCSNLTLNVIIFSFKPCHHDATDPNKVAIHVFAFIVPFGARPNPMLQPIHAKRHTDWLSLAGFDKGCSSGKARAPS